MSAMFHVEHYIHFKIRNNKLKNIYLQKTQRTYTIRKYIMCRMFHVEHYIHFKIRNNKLKNIYLQNAAYIYNKKIYYVYNVPRGTLYSF